MLGRVCHGSNVCSRWRCEMPNVYLDFNATTPVEPAVMEAMLPWFTDRFWNAASAHGAGETARRALENARSQLAALINAASWDRAFSSARRAVSPAPCAEAAFQNRSVNQGSIASITAGSTGVVALKSR